MQIRPALFLDLDGTVRYSKNGKFINKPENVVLFDDVEEAIWSYKNQGYLVIGISNQGGVAFGHKSMSTVREEIQSMLDQFDQNPFDHIYVSPFHEDGHVEPYNRRSLLRKPSAGMLAIAENDFTTTYGIYIDLDNSIMVGDRPEDEECANNASIDFVHTNEFFGRIDSKNKKV